MRSRFVSAVVLAACALALAACGEDEQTPASDAASTTSQDKPVRLAFFSLVEQNGYVAAIKRGIETAVEEDGNTEMTTFDAAFDANKQFAQIQDALNSGNFDAFVISAVDAAGVVPLVEEAVSRGISVTDVEYGVGPDLEAAFAPDRIGVDGMAGSASYAEAGKGQGQALTQFCADRAPCKVILVRGVKGVPHEEYRMKGVEAEIAGADNVEIVATVYGGYEVDKSAGEAKTALLANKDADVVLSVGGDQGAAGADQAAQDLGLDDVTFIGDGFTDVGREAVLDGRWYATTMYTPRSNGELAAKMAIDGARGEKVGERRSAVVEEKRPLFVTEENAADFESEWNPFG